MQRVNGYFIELKQRLTTGTYDVGLTPCMAVAVPGRYYRIGKIDSASESSPTWSISTDEVSIAELADGLSTLRLLAGPKITSRETAEYGWPSYLYALALEGIVNLFDYIGHQPALLSVMKFSKSTSTGFIEHGGHARQFRKYLKYISSKHPNFIRQVCPNMRLRTPHPFLDAKARPIVESCLSLERTVTG
jgi:hypothetical protein